MTAQTTEGAPAMAALREPKVYDRVAFLPVGQLRIDPRYQRNISDPRIRRMSSNFDVNKADTLTVSARPDGFYVLDGQHRLIAARKASISGLWCLIHTDLSSTDEAALFVSLNTERTRPGADDIFKARLTYDPIAQDIERVVTEAGWVIKMKSHDIRRPRQTVGVVPLERWYLFGGPKFLATVLRISSEAWPDDIDNGRSQVLDAIGAFLALYEKEPLFKLDRLIAKLAEQSVTGFRQMLMAHKTGFSVSTQRGVGIDVILMIYNRSARGRFLPSLTLGERITRMREHQND